MKRKMDHSKDGARRGVALIVVLGFLSIMILMAVAFLTQSRMERLVAGVSLDAQRARQMARTALNAAMSDYSHQLYTEKSYMLPPSDSDFDLFLSSEDYASGEVQPALGANNGTLLADGLELMAGEARNWIPRRYLADEGYAMTNAHWILVRRDPSQGAGANNPIVGRYAYLCFDMSGGLDANLIALTDGVANVGNATNRSSVRDVGMGELQEMIPIQGLEDRPPDASLFKELRRGWHGFDSLAELILLNNGRYNGGENTLKNGGLTYLGTDYFPVDEGVSAEELPPFKVWGPKGSDAPRWREGDGWSRVERSTPALNPTNVSDLAPYSLASFRGWEYNPNNATWETNDLAAWDENDLWTPPQWEGVLGDVVKQFAGQTLPTWWTNAMGDYTNSVGYPAGTNYPSPKNVPMLNEVQVTVTPRIQNNGNPPYQLEITVALEVETWFPFPSPENERADNYTIAPTIGIGLPVGTADIWIPMRGNLGVYTIPPTQLPLSAPATFNATYNSGTLGLAQHTLNYSAIVDVTIVNTNANPVLLPAMPLQLSSILGTKGAGITIKTGAQVVDWMPASVLNLARDSGGTLPIFAADAGPSTPFPYEAIDPRLNYRDENDPAGTGWEFAPGSMGGVNLAATSRGYDSNGDSITFYCRNAPMISPVELGYLSTGEPWKTLEFCTKEGADALSRIVSRKMIDELNDVGVAYTNGTINPNTSSTNVLRAAFSRLRLKDNDDELDDTELNELATIFSQITASKEITDNSAATEFRGACMRGLDWIWAAEFQADGYLKNKGWSKNERHRLIERTWGLFNPNNSMFTTLVIGQVVKEGPDQPGVWSTDDLVTGERRAVALTWRDPTPPGLHKPHEMFVKMFKFLDE